MVRLSLQWVMSLLIAATVLWSPAEAMACISGLQWGMDSSTVEQRLEVSLETARSLDADSSAVYRVSTSTSVKFRLNSWIFALATKGWNNWCTACPAIQ